MIKMVVDVWKQAHLTQDQFEKRWLNEHGALVKHHAKALGFLKYVQSHKVPSEAIDAFAAGRGWQPPPDGLTEIWWESVAAMQNALSSAEGQKASAILEKDEVQFVDSKRVSAFLATENVIFDFTTQVS